ncbi:unnamed protein product [Calicophoron daubneyi]|uniref:Fcf2 pre-rRNA processing C-terminal domain-containing protein n=1 Tax=Calicophoron daubneyi TaxID=300641 RepID=A0AAV2TH98_CALDB
MTEKPFIGLAPSHKWKPTFQLSDCSSEYLKTCAVNYNLLGNPFSSVSEEISPEEENKLWQSLGVVHAVHDTDDNADPTQTNNLFYSTSVPGLNSKRELKRQRRAERESKLEKWFNMSKPHVTDEDRDDLELIRLRRAVTSATHVRRADTKGKFFQHGVIVDDPGSFYDRIPRKHRGKNLVDELLGNANIMKEQRKRYAKVERAKQEKRAAVLRQKKQRIARMKKDGKKRCATVVVNEQS